MSLDAAPDNQTNKRIIVERRSDTFYERNATGSITENGNGKEMILFEGDIVISLEELRKYYDINETTEKELVRVTLDENESHENNISNRTARSDSDKLWPNRRVPYRISSSFTVSQRNNIRRAMNTLSSHTCIRFVERTGQDDFIHFQRGRECSKCCWSQR